MAVSDQAVVTGKQLESLSINTIRTLSIDGVQKANSGHPGAPMGLAPVAYVLWQQFLRYDPADPVWPNRDRFVLSNGHASMLLYSMLYLSGVQSQIPPMSRKSCPRPRFRSTTSSSSASSAAAPPDILNTASPQASKRPPARLGQGIGNSVGMAIAGKWLAARYNRPGFEIFDYNVYAICGDGDMMEGVGSEAASLAGHLELPNLCWIYDANPITLDGPADWSFSEDVATRFRGYGWNVNPCRRTPMISRRWRDASINFSLTKDRPTLIIVNSHIGYGSPHKQDTSAAHGEPLGEEEVKLTKKFYGWPEDAQFLVPDGVLEHFHDGIGQRGHDLQREVDEALSRLRQAISRSCRPTQPHAAPRTAQRLGQQPAHVPSRRQRHGHSRELGQSAECGRAEHSLAGWRRPPIWQLPTRPT